MGPCDSRLPAPGLDPSPESSNAYTLRNKISPSDKRIQSFRTGNSGLASKEAPNAEPSPNCMSNQTWQNRQGQHFFLETFYKYFVMKPSCSGRWSAN